jgi:tetratricopeptide (TPR) repeat protein
MIRPLVFACSMALLGACANQPPAEQPPLAVAEPKTDQVEPPERAIPADSLYPLLLAEFAIRRQAYNTALNTYLEQSRILQDVGVARHTTHLAQFVQNDTHSLEAVNLWLELEPDDLEANNTAATLLARQQRPLEAMPHMALVARNEVQANFPLLLQGFAKLSPEEQAQLVAELNKLALEFPQDPALLLTQALIHTEFGQYDQALERLDALFAVEPYQHQALLLEARVKLANENKRPYQRIEQALEVNPEDARLRLEYAKLLTNTDMTAAREQFEILSAQNPNDADLLLSLALINRENGDDLIARAYLKQMLELGKRNDEAHYYLGRIAEDRKELEQAISHYQQIGDSRQFLAANQRLGQLLVKSGQFERSRSWFAAQRQALPSRSEQLYGVEADILSSAGYTQASRETLNMGITDFPDSTALRYARSMVAEQQGDLSLMEQDLRAILAGDPQNATALNALGYTLANRTDRIDEAYQLISRALELDPEEPAILDSMGWVLYRKGLHQEAIEYLSRAYAVFPDPEVAAHLGEVLWVTGDTAGARQVWQGALLKDPQHPIVLSTLQRLGVDNIDTNPLGGDKQVP